MYLSPQKVILIFSHLFKSELLRVEHCFLKYRCEWAPISRKQNPFFSSPKLFVMQRARGRKGFVCSFLERFFQVFWEFFCLFVLQGREETFSNHQGKKEVAGCIIWTEYDLDKKMRVAELETANSRHWCQSGASLSNPFSQLHTPTSLVTLHCANPAHQTCR